jgi:hypothetical protein
MSATRSPDRLYELLPAVYREQDADQDYALRALLRIVTSQVDVVERDIAGLYDDLFIETCRRWVIPYIGDLVSNNLLYDAGRIADEDTARSIFTDLVGPDLRPPVAIRTRADVAKTIYYRRRKGTLPMLEELARDVTGWAAHAVEFFELLGWTQMLEHFRPQAAWFDVRSLERDERVDGPFDEASHSVDVRQISQFEGWHSIRNVGFFLWRLGSYPLIDVPARKASAPWRFHFSPLGNTAPLFTHLRREGDDAGLATELHVPGPIRRAFFARDLAAHRGPPAPDFTDLYGSFDENAAPLAANPDASLFVKRNGTPVPPDQVICARLDPWPAAKPVGAVIAIDVVAGRAAVGDGFAGASNLDVSYHYGFPADIGGGPYDRRKWLVADDPAAPLVRYRVQEGVCAPPVTFPSVAAALAFWALPATGRPDAVISILDSRTYALPPTITLADTSRLAIEAADGERPVLTTDPAGLEIDADGTDPDPDVRGTLTLSGVVVEGFVHVAGDLSALRLVHSTLVPGRSIAEGSPASTDPSIVVDASAAAGSPLNTHFQLQIASSISGPIVCPESTRGIWILDSIVDGLGGRAVTGAGTGRGPALTVERSTLLGRVDAHELEASESIFTGLVRIARTQAGCVRFSFVPRGSRTPRRHRCEPDLGMRAALDEALALDPGLTQAEQDAIRDFVAGWLQPSFAAVEYGQPAYCQLRLRAPVEIGTGAADGSEMGVYCPVKQPQRESNLRIRLDEYLPFGLEAGVVYVT